MISETFHLDFIWTSGRQSKSTAVQSHNEYETEKDE